MATCGQSVGRVKKNSCRQRTKAIVGHIIIVVRVCIGCFFYKNTIYLIAASDVIHSTVQ